MDLEKFRVPEKTVIFAQKKGGFSLLWNHCSGVRDLKVEFYTEDLAKEKR